MFQSSVRRYERDVIGLPENGKFVAISNSDLKKLPCRRQFFYSEVLHMKAPPSARMDAGNAWDHIIGDIYTWWMLCDTKYPTSGLDDCVWCDGTGRRVVDDEQRDCEFCDATGDSVVRRVMGRYHEQYATERETRTDGFTTYALDEIERTEEALRRQLDGYLEYFQGGPLQSMKIVAVQPKLARQIMSPKGKPLRAQVVLEELENGDLRLAGPAARGALKRVSWPWYYIGALDALAADRVTAAGVVIDAKQSTQPGRYQDGLLYDPQLPGYCWLVEAHLERFGLSGVKGFMYDAVNAKFQPDPKELQWKPPKVEDMKAMCAARGIETKGAKKSEDYMALLGITQGHGGFSLDQRAGVPSWRYVRAVQAAGLDLADYEDHIQTISEQVDRSLYRRFDATYSRERREQFGREVYAKAALVAALRKAAAALPSDTGPEVDVAFDRQDVCTTPGASCSYKGPCAMDAQETRAGYHHAPSQMWGEDITTRVVATPDSTQEPVDDESGFDW